MKDLALSIVLVLAFMAVAQWKADFPGSLPWLNHDYREHIGAEYNCIAQAIRQGRGFSDPFQCETGPTAWMPPVLPYLMAGLYWLHGDERSAMVEWMVALQVVSTALATFLLLRESRRLGNVAAGPIIAILVLSTNFYQLFQQTHDVALLLIVVSLLWLGLTRPRATRDCNSGETTAQASSNAGCDSLWGVWGALCTLCSPIVGGAWLLCTLWQTRPRAWRLCDTQRWLVILSVWLLLLAPWTVRNYLQFGKLFPVKPNGMYELWQSHCRDGDGVLDWQACSGHPWSSDGSQRRRYQEVGEIAFIEEKAVEVRQRIRANPLELAERIGNRAVAALLLYNPFSFVEGTKGSGWPVLWVRCVHPLPFIAVLLIGFIGVLPVERKVALTIALFGLILLPYVLVSYYDRYAAILAGIKMLLILYGWEAVVSSRLGRLLPGPRAR